MPPLIALIVRAMITLKAANSPRMRLRCLPRIQIASEYPSRKRGNLSHLVIWFNRRLLQNRESAQRFRVKRKSEFDILRQKVADLQTENSSLKSEVSLLHKLSLNIFEIPKLSSPCFCVRICFNLINRFKNCFRSLTLRKRRKVAKAPIAMHKQKKQPPLLRSPWSRVSLHQFCRVQRLPKL